MFDAALLWGEDYDLCERLNDVNVKEVSCQSMLCHCEPVSVKGTMIKNLHYGESMPTFMHRFKKQVFSRLIRHSLLTWGEVFSEFGERPSITLGCTIPLGIKAFAMMAGLLASLA
jgi:hypothetical protein